MIPCNTGHPGLHRRPCPSTATATAAEPFPWVTPPRTPLDNLKCPMLRQCSANGSCPISFKDKDKKSLHRFRTGVCLRRRASVRSWLNRAEHSWQFTRECDCIPRKAKTDLSNCFLSFLFIYFISPDAGKHRNIQHGCIVIASYTVSLISS